MVVEQYLVLVHLVPSWLCPVLTAKAASNWSNSLLRSVASITPPSTIPDELCLVYVAPIYLLPHGVNSNSNPFNAKGILLLVSVNFIATANPEPSTDCLVIGKSPWP